MYKSNQVHTKDQVPSYTFSQKSPRGFYVQTTPTGFLISKLTRRKSRPTDWPPGSGVTTGLQHPAASNRQFRQFIFNCWRHVLTTADRANWQTLGGSYAYYNTKGRLAPDYGYALFVHHHTLQIQRWYIPPAPFAPDPSKLSNPTMIIGAGYPAVSLITATAVSAGQFTLSYSTGAGFPSATLSVQISNPHRRTTSSYGSQFSLLAGLAQVGPPLGGVYSSTANYQDIIEIPPRPGLRTLRVSAIPDTTDWQLAFLTTFQLDLSINVP